MVTSSSLTKKIYFPFSAPKVPLKPPEVSPEHRRTAARRVRSRTRARAQPRLARHPVNGSVTTTCGKVFQFQPSGMDRIFDPPGGQSDGLK